MYRVEITNVSYFKVSGNNVKMHVAYFWRPRLYKIILGMAVRCIMYVVFCLLMLVGIYHKKRRN